MKMIVCLDLRNGMLFNNRRQSADRAVRRRIIAMTNGASLWMNGYSAKQFSEESANITVDEDFLLKAAEQDYCFAETEEIVKYFDRVSQLIIYRWNSIYPSDTNLSGSLSHKEWKFVRKTEFSGHSHNLITEEIYSL